MPGAVLNDAFLRPSLRDAWRCTTQVTSSGESGHLGFLAPKGIRVTA